MKLRTLLATLVLLVPLAAPVSAEPFEDGVAAYNRGDYATAIRLWRPLAAQGHLDATYSLGVMYHTGQGVTQDYAEAMKWFRLAAFRGHVVAYFNLGVIYRTGQGVTQDYAEAMKLFRIAAILYAPALHNLGIMYEKGEGVPRDFVEAHKWYNLAASRFSESEKENRDNAVKGRDLVARKMTPAQIAKAQRLAREWEPGDP